MVKNLITIFILGLLLSSCFKKDEMVPAHEPGDVITAMIPLTLNYSYQVYFSLEDEKIVSINDRSAFDLNFNCADTSTIVRLNTANFAKAAETMYTDLVSVTDTNGLIWKFDKSDGDNDSLAISNWISISEGDTMYSNKVWVINRGIDAFGNGLGLKKVKFAKIDNGDYYFIFSNMDNSDLVEGMVKKDDKYLYKQYSFDDEAVVIAEPEKSDWDLLFTQYTTLLFTDEGDPYPYLLTGVLQNYNSIEVALDTTLLFSEILLSDTAVFQFSKDFDKIGYDWKDITGDINTGDIYYEVKLDNTYIIRDGNSFLYKLRFINFYNSETGEKGFPTFEFQKL